MGAEDDFTEKLNALSDAISRRLDCDVILYSGPMRFGSDDRVIGLCLKRRRRRNVMLVLSTFGGQADVAYRIARRMQAGYEKFIVFVHGYCKSAGTLLALGAHEIVLSDYAELGPLDVQVRNTDEAGERSSGLAPTQALDTLQAQALNYFEESFVRLRNDLEMTTRVAAEIASKLTVGLLGHVYGQIDPIRLGELSRETRLAIDYGERLVGSNKKKGEALTRLVSGYPSHGFVIDRLEAQEFLDGVRAPEPDEAALAEHIVTLARYPAKTPIIDYLGTETSPAAEASHGHESQSANRGVAAGAGPANGGDGGATNPVDAREPGKTDSPQVSDGN